MDDDKPTHIPKSTKSLSKLTCHDSLKEVDADSSGSCSPPKSLGDLSEPECSFTSPMSSSRSASPVIVLEQYDNTTDSIPGGHVSRPVSLNLHHKRILRGRSAPPQATQTFSSDFLKKRKVPAIFRALNTDPVDIITLRRHAISKDGLINDALRRKAWPKLLNVNIFNIGPKPTQKMLKAHRDYNQVVLDVNRSLRRFPPGMADDERSVLQDQLVDVIMRTLVKHKDLHYYQGYHDICVTFLLVVGEDVTFALIDKLSTNHLRDFMDKTMERTTHMLNYLYPIIGTANPKLRQHMERAELGTIFCLPWLITWYGHVLGDVRHVVRLYDFFLACHPLMPIYLAAALVLYRETEVLATQCDMPMIHCLLSRIPTNLPVELLISKAGDLYVQYPPDQLAHEAQQHFKQSSSIGNYDLLIKSCQDQRPDSVLEESKRNPVGDAATSEAPDLQATLVRYSVWALSAGVSAAALAVMTTAIEWQWFS